MDDDGRRTHAGLKRDERRERLALLGLGAPALLLVLVTMVLPVGWLFWPVVPRPMTAATAWRTTARMIEQPSYGRIFVTTFEVSVF